MENENGLSTNKIIPTTVISKQIYEKTIKVDIKLEKVVAEVVAKHP